MTKAEKTALEMLELYLEAGFEKDESTASEQEDVKMGGDGSESEDSDAPKSQLNDKTSEVKAAEDGMFSSTYSSSSEEEVGEKVVKKVSDEVNESVMSSSAESD